MIDKYIYRSNATLEDLLISLDKSGEGFLPIVDENNVLIGVVTDGDIRRAFLNKVSDVNLIINKNPYTAPKGTSKEQALIILKKAHRRHLPIVDSDKKLVEIIKLDNWEEFVRPNKVVIMAGGLGSRLGELTKDIPKPMLPLGNKPILENLITSFKNQGYIDFIISVNYKAEIIKNYFKDGAHLGVSISYVEEKERLGTAGAISLIKEEFNHPFIVINGDILSTLNYSELLDFHLQKKSIATMCVAKKTYTIQYGVIQFNQDNSITTIQEKPGYDFYINAGIYVLSPEAVKFIPEGKFFDMPSLFELLNKSNYKTYVFPINDYWLDIGLKDDYFKALNDISGFNL
jgi:dTDP-glucose pyrophosphorylase